MTEREMIERLRESIRKLDLHPVVDTYTPRAVWQRNMEEKPRVVDAVLLDDLWQALDVFAALSDHRATPDEPGKGER